VRAVLLLGLLLGAATAPAAEDGWRQGVEQDGIRVDQKNVTGRGLPMFRARGRIDAPLDDVLAVILDVERQTEWMPRFEEIRVLRSDGPLHAVFYLRMGMPWPVSDRDAVLATETRHLDGGRTLTRFWLADDEGVEPVSGIVRMAALQGHYALRPIDDGTTEVEYQVDADPGGLIPDWLAARTATDDPLQALRNLRSRATATRTR
jgi:hypothetical protein